MTACFIDGFGNSLLELYCQYIIFYLIVSRLDRRILGNRCASFGEDVFRFDAIERRHINILCTYTHIGANVEVSLIFVCRHCVRLGTSFINVVKYRSFGMCCKRTFRIFVSLRTVCMFCHCLVLLWSIL